MSNRNNQKDEGSKTPQQGNNGGFGIDRSKKSDDRKKSEKGG